MNFKFSIIVLIILGLVLPGFTLAQEGYQGPETLEEAESMGLDILKALPNAVKKVWEEQALPVWLAMWAKFKAFWDAAVWPRIAPWWAEKKPSLEQEFQKEKTEMKEDLPKSIETGQSLWERFKDLLD